jgi:hypothetical protein
MRNTYNRRHFIGKLSIGVLTTAMMFYLFKPNKLYANKALGKAADPTMPLLNPAFRINVYRDGSVELYTFNSEREKESTTYTDIEADVLLKILKKTDPRVFDSELGSKYKLLTNEYNSRVTEILRLFEEKGFIYYGDIMKVKVRKKENE